MVFLTCPLPFYPPQFCNNEYKHKKINTYTYQNPVAEGQRKRESLISSKGEVIPHIKEMLNKIN